MPDIAIAAVRPRAHLLLLLSAAACAPAARTAPEPAGPPAPVAAPAPARAPEPPARVREPIPPVDPSPEFQRAVERGTRTTTGRPGPRYWQQWAVYTIRAELDTATAMLSGTETVRYHNRSPDSLGEVYLHVLANIFAPGAPTNDSTPRTSPVAFSRVVAQGAVLGVVDSADRPGYRVDGTVMRIRLPRQVPPGGSVDLEFAWRLPVPPEGAPRGGQTGSVYVVSYWYPQMAVYDDVVGWQTDPYLGQAEFYMGYGRYDVSLTVPAGWLVTATGTLQNPREVLGEGTRRRLASARSDTAVVRVVGEAERGPGRATLRGRNGRLTWRFAADTVRDFTWGASSVWLWDATHAAVGDVQGDGRPDTSLVQAFYTPEGRKSSWGENARFGRHSVEFLSRSVLPYPYPHMTAVEGPRSCGGMEYPMLTCIGGTWDSLGMYEVTVHEIGHMWFPMVVGSDEKRHSWMDEGLTQFNQSQGIADFYQGRIDDERQNRTIYLSVAQARREGALMVHGDRYADGMAFGIASYFKPATMLVTLREILGRPTFERAWREYAARWRFRHPKPYDLFATFEDVSGRDLDWFWRSWAFETWTMDQAIAGVTRVGDRMAIAVEDRGMMPLPARLAITRADGRVDRLEIPVEAWLAGATRQIVTVPAEPAVVRVVIDPEMVFPDVDRRNQTWRAP
jgi:hypothetical protein